MERWESAASSAVILTQSHTYIHSVLLGLARAYLLESNTGLVLIDAGAPGQEKRVLRLMRRLGRRDLRLILITHAHLDHFGSAAALHQMTGAPIAIHQADAPAMLKGETRLGSVRGRGKILHALLPILNRFYKPPPTPAHLSIRDEFDLRPFGLEAVALHTPGHTPGSMSVLLENRHAFVGDLVSTTGKPHSQRFFATDWSQLFQSLQRIQQLEPAWIYPGHGSKPLDGSSFQALVSKVESNFSPSS